MARRGPRSRKSKKARRGPTSDLAMAIGMLREAEEGYKQMSDKAPHRGFWQMARNLQAFAIRTQIDRLEAVLDPEKEA